MIVCCFKWARQGRYIHPHVCDYDYRHVNALYLACRRHYRGMSEFVCVTDDRTGIDERVRIVPLWEDWKELGGAYRRLGIYGPYASLIGRKFLCIDLDSVICGDLTPLAERTEPLVLNKYMFDNAPKQHYNSALQLVTAGCHPEVWSEFRGWEHADTVESDPELVGTEQAWLAAMLGPDIPTYSPADGVYDAGQIQATLPGDARIVFFHGDRDPSMCRYEWAKQNWRPTL